MTGSRERIEARRAIQERASVRRREREQKEQQIAELAVTVNVALHEGRRTLRQAEQTAGSALTQMIHVEGLAVTEAIDWVGDPTLTVREVSRLRTLAGNSPELTSGRANDYPRPTPAEPAARGADTAGSRRCG